MNPIEAFIILFVMVGFVIGVILMFNSVSGLGTVNDTVNIDTILSKNPTSYFDGGTYKFTDNSQVHLSNSSIVCPSNDCKTIMTNPTLSINEQFSTMFSSEDFILVDDISNGQLGPKKQKLIEKMYIDFGCMFDDIQEDIESNTTKYICSGSDGLDITRTFNSIHYPYRFNATFELPSRQLGLNATEVHENPIFSSGNRIFRNETGQIVVK